MSNKLWANYDSISDSISAVRSDSNPTQWTLIGFNDKFDELQVVATGNGSVEELVPLLQENNAYYSLVRKTEVIDESETVKFVFIKFAGHKIKPLYKGKVTTTMGDITGRFQPYHVDMSTHEVEEITDEQVTNLVGSASMNRSNVIDKNAGKRIMDENRLKNESRSINRQYTSGLTSSPSSIQASQASPVPIRSPSVKVSTPVKSTVIDVPTQSKEVSYVEEQWINNAIADVRNDNTDTDWMLVKSESGSIELVDVGAGGVDELSSRITQEGVYYGLVRLSLQIDNSTTTKFAFVHYIGPNVKPTVRAKVSTHKGTVSGKFLPFHVELVTSDQSELKHDALFQLVASASGTKSNVLGDAGSPAVLSPTTYSQQKPISRSPSTTASLTFKDESSCRQSIASVRDDSSDVDWMLLSYHGSSKTELELVGSGTGGADALASLLEPSKVYYGLVRAEEIIDQSVTVKFAFVHYLGNTVPPMLKARVSTHKGVVEDFLRPYHVTLFATEASEVNQKIVQTLIAKASQSYNAVLN
ncbi:coactosin [Acrasis kona]|uniref:Coactosin n=1 Tax=Acrasis kona TaxID=1008807 RepID=A0AAW2ZPS6_9EUKA